MPKTITAMDGNTAAGYVAHATNEVIAIYPITPSSVMGELADIKSAKGDKNIWGTVPLVIEMQSEGGASGAVHGALTAGALTTTFTASQGLLLMIPNMYKIAGELTSTVFHVSARALASHALSIFGDHSDVMACRQTGWALLASANPQEAMDFALISQAASLKSRVPFLHFFDGFRTSHELNMVEPLSFDAMRAMLSEKLIAEHKARGLNPEHPVLRGTAQNPDVFFQAREACNKYYQAVPAVVKETMDQFAKLTGRKYGLFDYVGAPDAEKLVIVMASGADTVEETVNYLNANSKEKTGVLKVRLYRPYSETDFIKALPKTVKSIAVLDRTKEPGSIGEPMYQDVVTACANAFKAGALKQLPLIVGGRYGLGSKEFTPAMAKAVIENLSAKKPVNGFTVGIKDDVTNLSLPYDENWAIESADIFRALFFGLGSDGTVGANKNTIKIISEETGQYAQGYFVYDSKKAGSMTVSHVRFGKNYIRAPYLVYKARFIGCHQFSFLEKYEMLDKAENGAIFLINSPFKASEVWDHLPVEVQENIIKKNLKVYVINASEIANETGMGARINVIMQTAFFGISGVLPKKEAVDAIKKSIKKTYASKGDEVVNKNFAAVDRTLAAIEEVKHSGKATSKIKRTCAVENFPAFVRNTLCEMMAFKGDGLPVSAMPVDGTFPTATSQYEKRNIALESPVWDENLCIQCGICSLVCPHAAIRIKAYDGAGLAKAPKSFKSAEGKGALKGLKFTAQVAVEDCTGCGACVYNCPAKEKAEGKETGRKAINLQPQFPLREPERENLKFFMSLKDTGSAKVNRYSVQGSQLVRPLFEFSGACAGCGETPYVKLMTQLFGDHLTVANATGCSSIYGGNLPSTPYCTREDGCGPAWSNSLFEDNAEFGLGMRLAYDKLSEEAGEMLNLLKAGPLKAQAALADEILNSKQDDWAAIEQQRGRVADLKKALSSAGGEQAARMLTLADYLIKKSVWILGGDGWAYDIGYGGLDHVLASGRKVRAMVLDTEVYSNTGGQMSKSTPLGAVALFAAGGKPLPKKDLGMISMTYGNIYVAQIAMGANYLQAVKAMAEAEAYDGPSIIIAYSHCIAHGIDMRSGMNEQKKAVASGRWPLYRFNPALKAQGKNPLTIDSAAPSISVADFMMGENRFRTLHKSNPETAKRLLKLAEEEYKWRLSVYKQIAAMSCETQKVEEKVAV
ncbi:MAG: pyruvate:ferredoxin (flavodoxin) oxidoreductase [Elusimicrobia bacterium GWA2_51_34]|nr:MAG: pyruvate:ferredoxin (flavodoxin) oxidoreductase [Elusimicrobia bacterium GWA2_51_34]